MAAILTVTDHADPSVGLFSQSWKVESPFKGPKLDDEYCFDAVEYEAFRSAIIDAYSEIADGKVTAAYEWENIEPLNPETPCT